MDEFVCLDKLAELSLNKSFCTGQSPFGTCFSQEGKKDTGTCSKKEKGGNFENESFLEYFTRRIEPLWVHIFGFGTATMISFPKFLCLFGNRALPKIVLFCRNKKVVFCR